MMIRSHTYMRMTTPAHTKAVNKDICYLNKQTKIAWNYKRYYFGWELSMQIVTWLYSGSMIFYFKKFHFVWRMGLDFNPRKVVLVKVPRLKNLDFYILVTYYFNLTKITWVKCHHWDTGNNTWDSANILNTLGAVYIK